MVLPPSKRPLLANELSITAFLVHTLIMCVNKPIARVIHAHVTIERLDLINKTDGSIWITQPLGPLSGDVCGCRERKEKKLRNLSKKPQFMISFSTFIRSMFFDILLDVFYL